MAEHPPESAEVRASTKTLGELLEEARKIREKSEELVTQMAELSMKIAEASALAKDNLSRG
jgi:hypothetical protein